MRRSKLMAGLLLLIPSVAGVQALAPPPSHAVGALIDPDDVYVSDFEGWGTAPAWGANVVGGWPDAKRTAIADLLFSDSGLGLNVFRYHIGAGLNPNWQALGCAAHRPGSPLPTFSTSQGVYDWTADANQRWFAQAAKARGVDTWLAYASAPPYWMTINGCTNGGDGGGQNLKGYWGYDGNGTGAYNSTTSYSNNTDDSVTVKFSGTQISFYAAKSSDSGKAALSVDGGAETTVDLYSATRQGNQLVFTSPALASGNHTLKVRVTGTKNASSTATFVSPDRVVVSPGSVSVDDHVRGTGLNQFDYHWNMYEPFADYLTEVTKHFRDQWGITFDLIDPLNEPDASWWTKTTRQEGAHFDPPSQNELITRVGQSLVAKGLTGTSIAANDGDTVANAVSSFNSYSAAAKSYISTLATHTYITSQADQVSLRNTAATAGKKLWMTRVRLRRGAIRAGPWRLHRPDQGPAGDQPGHPDRHRPHLPAAVRVGPVGRDRELGGERRRQRELGPDLGHATSTAARPTRSPSSTTATGTSPSSSAPATRSSPPTTPTPSRRTTRPAGRSCSWSTTTSRPRASSTTTSRSSTASARPRRTAPRTPRA